MKVSELIKELQTMDQDLIVVLSSDSDGNEYHELDTEGIANGNMAYHSDEKEICLAKLTQDDIDMGYGDDDVRDGGEPCLVLYP